MVNSLVEYTIINKLGSKNGYMHVKDRRGKKSVAFIQLAQSLDPEKTKKNLKNCVAIWRKRTNLLEHSWNLFVFQMENILVL